MSYVARFIVRAWYDLCSKKFARRRELLSSQRFTSDQKKNNKLVIKSKKRSCLSQIWAKIRENDHFTYPFSPTSVVSSWSKNSGPRALSWDMGHVTCRTLKSFLARRRWSHWRLLQQRINVVLHFSDLPPLPLLYQQHQQVFPMAYKRAIASLNDDRVVWTSVLYDFSNSFQ